MSRHPLRDLIASRVAQREADLIPLPKYMLAVTISANTLNELHQAVDQLSIDFLTEWRDREQVDSTDGRTSVVLDVTSPSQTPERYAEQLTAWSAKRRADRTVCSCHRDPDGTVYGADYCDVHKATDRTNRSEETR